MNMFQTTAVINNLVSSTVSLEHTILSHFTGIHCISNTGETANTGQMRGGDKGALEWSWLVLPYLSYFCIVLPPKWPVLFNICSLPLLRSVGCSAVCNVCMRTMQCVALL